LPKPRKLAVGGGGSIQLRVEFGPGRLGLRGNKSWAGKAKNAALLKIVRERPARKKGGSGGNGWSQSAHSEIRYRDEACFTDPVAILMRSCDANRVHHKQDFRAADTKPPRTVPKMSTHAPQRFETT